MPEGDWQLPHYDGLSTACNHAAKRLRAMIPEAS